MKISIRVKLFLILGSIIFLFVVTTQLFSSFLLEDFYLSSKKKLLKESLTQAEEIISKDLDFEEELAVLQENKNIIMVLVDNDYATIFRPAFVRKQYRNNDLPPKYIFPHEEELFKDDIDRFSNSPSIVTRTDRKTNIEYLSLYAPIRLPDGTQAYTVISTSVDAMKDSVKAASDFILYVSLFVAAIGIVVIYYVSRSISKPIVKLGIVTEAIANLDFTQRMEVQSTDEIGDLSRNINFLSEKLDKTLSQLAVANTQLKKDIMLQEKIDQSRKELIANISHELKTPISIIGGYAEGLKVNINEKEKDLYCDVIMDETQKMNKLVLSLLDLSQVEAGYKQMNRQAFDISLLIDKTLEKYKFVFADKEIKLTVSYEGDCMIMADPERVEQALTNYLTNALNHVDLKREIIVHGKEMEQQVIVSIFNSGKMIAQDQTERIWESFYKIDQARTREYGGSGLGLFIVQAIISAHGGQYGVTNDADGPSFWFILSKE
ncbi:sensor histidine kinase [Paenibacillus sp. CMAA1364]